MWGGGGGCSQEEGWAVAQRCRTLMNDHPTEACHLSRRVSALLWMDSRGGNLSRSEHGRGGGVWWVGGSGHLKEHLGLLREG